MSKTAEAQKETHGFQTEVKQLLHLMINSLYSNPEIFLRELIANASDAADKQRFEALSNPDLHENDAELAIKVEINKENNTISISDNGIGMSRDEIIEHLGTIAKSGTKEFLSNLTGDQKKDSQMIGQFGVGFYSSFIVADKVTVKSRRAGLSENDGVEWESKGDGEYTLEAINKPNRGTEIILHIKPDHKDFLESFRLRSIITKYADHISIPVLMEKPAEVKQDEEGDETKTENTTPEFEPVNQAKALWTRPKSEIKDEDYQEFYKHISHDFQDALTWAHNRVEGKFDYTSLIFLPKNAPFDLYNRDQARGLKLYVQRVFIMDDAEQFLPMYLRFVKGVIDSNDLPLNVSREILQSSKVVDSIKSGVTKRVLSLLETMSKDKPEEYANFWKEFGSVIKEGPAEDSANKDRIAKLLRFSSTHDDKETQEISLDDYAARMQPGQDKIYFVTADTFLAAKNSPQLEIFRNKNIEVLLLCDRVDEWLTGNLTEFDGKQLQSISKGQLDLGDLEDKPSEEEEKQISEDYKDIIEQMKKSLGEKVKDIRITHRLTDSPACIVADEYDMGMNLQRMMAAAGQNMPGSKPILELNPTHPIVTQLKAESDDDKFNQWSHILLDQAILAEGGQLEDPATFVKLLNKMMLNN